MKKILIKLCGILIGLLNFNLIYSLIEYYIIRISGIEKTFFGIYRANFLNVSFIYFIIGIILFIINYIYVSFIVENLNVKLEKIKGRKDTNE